MTHTHPKILVNYLPEETNNERTMQQYTMRGYVARDKHKGDLSDLFFGVVYPKYDPICGTWYGFGEFIALPKDWFPELKYTDKPIAVELIIKRP